MINWEDISYLKFGNKVQKHAHTCLLALGVFEQLSSYNPVLVGTVPISINLKDSDLDIICEIKDNTEFSNNLNALYSANPEFNIKKRKNYVVCSFFYDGFPIEIYGEQKPVKQQNAYLHMLAEYKILNLAGSRFKQAIIQLKQNGFKTEPAFGYLLGVENAYTELLEFTSKPDIELLEIINKSNWQKRINKIRRYFGTLK